ncbi:unnamed protein product, partial [Ixodes persulcatus]
AVTAKIRNLHDYHTRILHGLPPLPSGVDVANTLKYFSQTLLSVLKDVPSIPLDMIRCHEKDHARTTLFPSLDYKALYHAIVQLVDAVPIIQSGAHALGHTILNTLACLVPFLEHEYMDTLPYIVASSMALFPNSLHKDIVDMLCNHLLPYTISNPVDADALNYANMSTSAVIMMVFQYTENMAYQTQLLECLMSLKRDIVKDLLCVIAHGTAKARHPAVEMLFHYWPTLNPMLRDKKGFSIRHSGQSTPSGWKPLTCQRESCVSSENKEAYKMCLDHSIAIASGERPPPLFVCQGCADQIRREHGPNHLMDVLLPMQEIALTCENKNCSTRDKSASITCFSMECASYNGNKPIRYCNPCFQARHSGSNERASQHVALRPIPSPWSMDRETQLYFVEAIVSLLKEAQPTTDKGGVTTPGKESTTERHSRSGGALSEGPEESLECMAQEERQLLSRYGVWLLVGLCTPEDNTPQETLGRLLGMLFQWFHYTACLPDDQTGNALERLKTEYIHGWLMDIVRTHFDVFVSCLLPHPAEYAQVGGHWDNWPCQTDQIKEGFKTLLCLVPYDIINREVWEYIMPHWMEAFRFEIPEEELSELKILLSKVLDPDLSPLGFNIKQMYGFLTARFENTTAQVQEQALYWLQILTMLEVPVPMNLLFSMFPAGVQATLGPAPSSSEPKEEAHVATLTPKFHPLRQDTTGTMLGSLGLDCDQLPSFLPEDAPPREDKSDAELCLSCHILMVDILIKQLELQEVTPHRGLNTSEAREILSLLHAMLRYPRAEHQCCQTGSAGGAGGVPAACLFCEMSAIWYQLVLSLIEFFCPVMEVAMADVSVVPGTRLEPVCVPCLALLSLLTGRRSVSPSKNSVSFPFQESPEAPHEHEVGPSPEGPVLMTATVQECPGQLDTVAIMPTEQVVTAFARAVTLTEDDVRELSLGCTKYFNAVAGRARRAGRSSSCCASSASFLPSITLQHLARECARRQSTLVGDKHVLDTRIKINQLRCHTVLTLSITIRKQQSPYCPYFSIIGRLIPPHFTTLFVLISVNPHCAVLFVCHVLYWLPCINVFIPLCSPCTQTNLCIAVARSDATLFCSTPCIRMCRCYCFMLSCYHSVRSLRNSQHGVGWTAMAVDDGGGTPTSILSFAVPANLSSFEREILDRSKQLGFIPYDTPYHPPICTKTSPSRRPFSWLKTSLVLQTRIGRSMKNTETSSMNLASAFAAGKLAANFPTYSQPAALRTRSSPSIVTLHKMRGTYKSGSVHFPRCPILPRRTMPLSDAEPVRQLPTQHLGGILFGAEHWHSHLISNSSMYRTTHLEVQNSEWNKHNCKAIAQQMFLSRPDQSHPTEEKAMARNQLIVLRHINVLLGYSQSEKGFLISPSKLRMSPVFNAFLVSMPKVLDYNFRIGSVLLSTCMPVLIYCPSPQRYSHEHASPRYSLWLLDPPARHSWLMAVLVILYKFDYESPPLSRQVQMLVRIILNTLDAQNHQCKSIPEPFLSPVPSRSRDLSTASVDLENIQEHDAGAPLDLTLGGDEIRFAFGTGVGSDTKAAYHKPLTRDIHDPEITRSGKDSAEWSQWKALKIAEFSCSGDEDDAEPELEAIPESPKSETSDLAEFGGELEVLAPSVPTAELAEQARVRVVKDVLPGQEAITVMDPSWQLAEEPVLVGAGDIDTQMASQLSSFLSSTSEVQKLEEGLQHMEKSAMESMEKSELVLPEAVKSDTVRYEVVEVQSLVITDPKGRTAADKKDAEASQSPSEWQNSSNVPTGSPKHLPDQRSAEDTESGKCETPQRRPEVRLPDVHPSDIRGKVAAVKKVFEARATSDAAAAFASSRRDAMSLDIRPTAGPRDRTLPVSKSTTDLDDGDDRIAPLSPSRSPKPRIHRMGAVDLGSLRVKPAPLAETAAAEQRAPQASPKEKSPKKATRDPMAPKQLQEKEPQFSPKKTTTEPAAPPKPPQQASPKKPAEAAQKPARGYVKEPATAQRSLDMLTAKLRGVPKETVHRTKSESSQATAPKPLPSPAWSTQRHSPVVLEPLMVRPTPERLLPIGPQPKASKPFMSKQLSTGSLGPGTDFRHRSELPLRQADVFTLDASRALRGLPLGPVPPRPIEIPSLERLLPVGPLPTRREAALDIRSIPSSPAKRLKSRSQSTDTTLAAKRSEPDLLASARVQLAGSGSQRDQVFTFPDVPAAAAEQHPSEKPPQRQPSSDTVVKAEEGGKGRGEDAAALKDRVRPQEHSISGGLIDMLVKDVILDKVLSAAGRVETAFFTHGGNSLEVKDDEEPATPHPDKGASDEARSRLHYRPRKQRKSGLTTVEIQRTLESRGGTGRRARKTDPGPGPTPSKRSGRPPSSRSGEDAVPDRCPECAVALEQYSDEELGLCVVLLATFVHRQPSLAAPLLPEILRVVARVASQVFYPWQHESNVHLPGGCNSVARQFIRCTLHQLSTNGIFQQIFQGNFDADFFKVMATALADFNELNQIQPLMILFEELNERKHVPGEQLLQVLGNVAAYLECLAPESNALLWTAFLPQLDALLRKLLLALPPLAAGASGPAPAAAAPASSLEPLLRLLLCVLRVPTVNTCKSILDPFSKILSYAIQHSLIQYQQLLELCHLCNRNMSRERDKQVFTRTVVFELVQALKFKSVIPDENLLVLVQFVLQDAGGILCPNVIVEDLLLPQDLQNAYNTGASECMRQNLNEVLEFVADVHALIRIKSNFHGTASRLNEETLGGQAKAGMAQYLALEITKGNGRDNRAIGKYLPWLYHPPSSVQQGPKEFIDCVAHIRLLSWLLVGALMHSALLSNTASLVCQPIPLEANSHIADHIQVILAGFAEQSKASVLHMSSLFHAFILCQLWTMYCEHMVSLNPPGSEQNQLCSLTLTDFWIKITPGILQLVCHSKLAEMVSLHFLSLMEALLECNSTVLARLLPMWTPVLYSYQGQLPGQLKVRLQACLDWLPPLQTREEATFVSSNFLKWLQRIQFKMGQIELQSSAATQFYSV